MQTILSALSIQQPEDLLSKKIKVEFFDERIEGRRNIFFTVTSFELTEQELELSPILTDQGKEEIQISFFKPSKEGGSIEFHILIWEHGDLEQNELGYFYNLIDEEDETQRSWNHILSEGKVTIL